MIHQRAAVGDGAPRVVELLDAEGAPPALSVREARRCGDAAPEALPAEEAARVAEAVRGGAPLEEALGGEPLSWSPALPLRGALEGWRLASREAADRYGAHRQVVLVAPDGAAVEVASADPAAAIAFAPLGELGALARVEGPGLLRDVRPLDLAAAARAHHVARGERRLAEGAQGAARESVEAAARFDPCERDGALPWLRARLLAAEGAPAEGILAALEEAIAANPGLYRMYARTSEALAPLRGDPRFVELTRPRSLPGT